jgi:hypothetical protein
MILQVTGFIPFRRFLTALAILFIHIHVLASNPTANIPKPVIEKFRTLFPNAGQVEWTKKRSLFRADFIYDNCTVSMTFSAIGELIRGTQEIKLNQLPVAIIVQLRENYGTYKALVVLEEYNNDRLTYEIELMKGTFHYILKFNSKGRLLNQYEVDKVSADNTIIN